MSNLVMDTLTVNKWFQDNKDECLKIHQKDARILANRSLGTNISIKTMRTIEQFNGIERRSPSASSVELAQLREEMKILKAEIKAMKSPPPSRIAAPTCSANGD